ncbi:MAG: ABC transporter ATP-binding protein [Rhodovibrionaceae bacterium]
MDSPLLEVTSLESGYGDVKVLWGIDIEIHAGKIVCLVGSNGAGKTTLLRTVSGVVRGTAGQVKFDGQDVSGYSAKQMLDCGIAHVPEGRRLFKGLTVRDNLLLGAFLRSDSRAIKEDLERAFEIFPILSERRNQDATTLSGGEQQMCAIARGMMSRPKLLMIDEMSLGLAPRLVEHLADTLIRVNKEGLTILLVEQDVITAFELAEEAFVIETGRVSNRGRTEELSKDPAIRQAYLGI